MWEIIDRQYPKKVCLVPFNYYWMADQIKSRLNKYNFKEEDVSIYFVAPSFTNTILIRLDYLHFFK